MAQNKRVGTFLLIILLMIFALLAWLAFIQPEPTITTAEEEISHDKVFDE